MKTSKNAITVIGTPSHQTTSEIADTFFAILTIDLCLDKYLYYAVSVSGNSIFICDVSVVIVGTKNHTTVNVTVPVSVLN